MKTIRNEKNSKYKKKCLDEWEEIPKYKVSKKN